MQPPDRGAARAPAEEAAYRAALAAASPRVPVTLALVAANVAVAAAAAAAGVPLLDPPAADLVRWGANAGPLTADGQWWRTLTSVFLHVGLVHLAVNAVALADLGRTAERLFGGAPFLFVYLASGAVGAACSVAWNPWVYSAGASGAIFGVVGALVAGTVAGPMQIPVRIARIHWLTAAGLLAFTVLAGRIGAGVDHAAHVGGFACGALLGRILARPLTVPRPRLGTGRTLLALSAAALSFAAAASGWRNVGAAHAEEQRFIAAARAFVAEDAARVDALRESFERWQRREQTRETHAADLARYAGGLREAAGRFDALALPEDSPSRPRESRAALVTALRVRADALDLRADAVARSDPRAAEAANRRIAEADAVWREQVCGEGGLFRCPGPAQD